jgi:hypothetical protein
VWSRSGSHWRSWDQSCVDLSDYAGKSVQVSFIATRGAGPLGDSAIDNVEMLQRCPGPLSFLITGSPLPAS